jgi:GDP/UDP-N,N'-diacetylbacillosamine 2-epimerase (hydrolysing)
MKIGVLSSSRADYSIYYPLLKAIEQDPFFKLGIIAFGTHLSPYHGYTVNSILSDGFEVPYRVESMIVGDSPTAVATSMALTTMKFADFWETHGKDFDLFFCLGDRYEMFAAVMSGIPFGIKFAHLHGGEKTLGAIDHVFRHSITLASRYHFVSCDIHARRVSELVESEDNIFNIGSLGSGNSGSTEIMSHQEFYSNFRVDLSRPTILVTVHPETVSHGENASYAQVVAETLLELTDYQVLITLPNADTNSSMIRSRFLKLPEESGQRIICQENLGRKGYYSAMKHCSFLLGNTSSGIIEAASFGKWVINLGNRQQGREQSENAINIPFNRDSILQEISKIEFSPDYKGTNIYFRENSAKNICSILKTLA